jgi:hypothetical protein
MMSSSIVVSAVVGTWRDRLPPLVGLLLPENVTIIVALMLCRLVLVMLLSVVDAITAFGLILRSPVEHQKIQHHSTTRWNLGGNFTISFSHTVCISPSCFEWRELEMTYNDEFCLTEGV